MALDSTLESAFGQGGFRLSTAVGSVTTVLTGTAPAGADLDDGEIGRIAGLLGDVDLGALAGPVQDAIQRAGSTAGGLPVVGDLLGPLTTALDAVEAITEGDTLQALQRLETAAAGAPAGVGLGGVAARLTALEQAREDPAVQGALSLLSDAVPGLDLTAPVTALGTHAPALGALVRLIGGLMTVDTITRRLGSTTELVTGMLDPDAAVAAARRLESWSGTDLASRLTGIDPQDEAAVLAALAPVRAFTADVKDAAAVLLRGLAFGEATLVDADLTTLAARLDAASSGLTESLLDPVRRAVLALSERLEPLLAIELGPAAASLEDTLAELTGFVDELVAAIEGFDTSALTQPVADGLNAALAPLRALESLAEEVIAAVRSAFGTIRQAVEAIDLRGVAQTVQAALRPIAEALEALERLIGDAQQAVNTAALAVTTAMNTVQTTLGGAATTIGSAFGRVQQIVEDLHLADLQREIEQGIQEVVTALEKAQLRPYFDAGIEVMDTAAGIVAAVPLDLLPDDAQQEVHEAVAPIKAIDFDDAVRNVLVPRLREILDAVDEDVLSGVEQAYQDVLDFLEGIDPRGAIEDLEQQSFDPMLERVREVDPVEILEPVQSVLDEVQGAIEGIDIRGDVLEPLDEAFGQVADAVAEFDPASFVTPIEERVDAAREQITGLLHLDTLATHLDDADAFVDRVLERIDFPALVALLDAAYDDIRPRPGRSPDGTSALGTVIGGLLEDTGAAPGMDAFAAVRRWVGGADGAAEVRDRLEAAAAQLEAVAITVRAADLQALAAGAQPVYRDLAATVAGQPEGSALRRYGEAVLAGASPLELLGSAGANQARYAGELDEAAALLRRLAASGRSEVTVIAAGLRDALRPLQAVPDRIMALLARFGADVEGRGLGEVLSGVAETFRPSSLLGPLQPAVEALRQKVATLVHEGLVAPLRTAVDDAQGAIDAVDLTFMRTELDGLYSELTADIEAFRPSTLLGELVTAAEHTLGAAADFDPLAPVRQVIDDMKAAIEAVANRFRPSVLFAPLLASYDHILELASGLDVRTLLEPIVTALAEIEVELEEGLTDAAAALTRLQDALP